MHRRCHHPAHVQSRLHHRSRGEAESVFLPLFIPSSASSITSAIHGPQPTLPAHLEPRPSNEGLLCIPLLSIKSSASSSSSCRPSPPSPPTKPGYFSLRFLPNQPAAYHLHPFLGRPHLLWVSHLHFPSMHSISHLHIPSLHERLFSHTLAIYGNHAHLLPHQPRRLHNPFL